MDCNPQWRGEDSGKATPRPPCTLAEFRAMLEAERNLKNRRSIDSEEEEELFYSSPAGYPGKRFFSFLCPEHSKARIRVERIYWDSWNSAVHSILFSGFGIIFLILGLVCLFILQDAPRSVVILFSAVLLCTPGFYGLHTLFMYARGHKDYSYYQLPGSD